MEQRTDKMWQSSTVVKNYLRGVRAVIPLASEQIEVMMRVIANREKPAHNFLDLGCGDGILGAVILERYPDARGTFLDFSEPMIDAARKKLATFGPQLTFGITDYANLNWIDAVTEQAPFDVVVSGYSIHHQPDERKQTLYAEIYNLLAPDGLFINIEHVASPSPWVESLWNNSFIDALHTMYAAQGQPKAREQIERDFMNSEERAANIVALVEDQCNWLRQIGFEDVDCYFKIYELAVFGGRRLA